MATTQAVLDHHLSAFGIGVDEIMKDFTEESVVITPAKTYRGLAEIRSFFQDFVDNFPPAAWESFTIDRSEVVADVAYLVWNARPFVSLGTDTFLVRDGKIAVQTFASTAG